MQTPKLTPAELMKRAREARRVSRPTPGQTNSNKITISLATAATRAEYVAEVKRKTPKAAGLFQQVLLGKSTRHKAIKAKCIDCNGFEDYIRRTANCPVVCCPLWPFRPYQTHRQTDAAAEDAAGE